MRIKPKGAISVHCSFPSDFTRFCILRLLNKKPMHGYEIAKMIETECCAGRCKVKPGTVYYSLKQLEGEGLIRGRWANIEDEGSGKPRQVYSITEEGKRFARDHAEDMRESARDMIQSMKHVYEKLL